MKGKSIYIKVFLLSAFSLSSYAKMNVGSSSNTLPVVAAKVSAGCRATTAQFDLDVNNVRARVLNGGDLWWDPVGQTPYYEVPIGSNKNSIYSGALWIAGIDNNNQIKAACQTYRQQGNDFWAGPISKVDQDLLDVSVATCEQYDRFWTITKSEVENFVATGEATPVIQQWPGNGNTALGQQPMLAPFIDVDNDGIYNHTAGDYPAYNLSGDYPVDPTLGVVCNDYLFGDKTVWWVFNDVGNTHTETLSPSSIGLEIRAQAFGFRTADDINNMTFYKYQIINRSKEQLNNAYFGAWCDPDLGNSTDDYVGCDVGLGLGYCYNGDVDDDGADGYGLNPPAVGIDFFQGPLADPGDEIDNDKDGVVDEVGEQIIMSKFVYYFNSNNNPTSNPDALDDYYQYLSGLWLDGLPITYGGNGRDQANPPCNYMFPGLSDPDNPTLWTMSTAGIQPDDMRWLQSAGTFTLKPGAVNYVTTGVVWAKASAGGPGASINLMKLADQKAQALFDNCFKVLDGPNAPDVAIRELDRQLILKLENTKSTKIEFYNEMDPTIPSQVPACDTCGTFVQLTDDERSYKFQGYRVYQIANKNVSSQELSDLGKAKLIRQIDLKDDIWKIVNYSFNGDLNAWFPTQVADSNSTTNVGLVHDLVITKDEFTGQNLINFKPYYYMVVSYAYNNFRPFDPSNGSFTQSQAFKQGRLNVKVYSAIPHKPLINNGGSVFNAGIGESFEVKRIEGQGNGGNILDFTDATVNEILTSSDHQSANPVYLAGRGPINPQVVDPVVVRNGDLKLLFEPLSSDPYWGLMTRTTPKADIINITIGDDASIRDIDTLFIATSTASNVAVGDYARLDNISGITSTEGLNQEFFKVIDVSSSTSFAVIGTGISGSFVAGTGTAEAVNDISTYEVSVKNSELISDHGIKLDIYNDASMEFGGGSTANGFLGASITENSWLSFLPDNGAGANLTTIYNWIRPSNADPGGVYQDVLGGTWAPAKSCNLDALTGVIPSSPPVITNFMKVEDLASVDIVFTNDKNKWTRSVVLESYAGSPGKYLPRIAPSLDKNFSSTTTGGEEEHADFISATGMSWFPGYAINLETGERLNIAFCENSSLPDENGADMKFNPTSNITNSNGADVLGGMHYIWVFGHNLNGANDVPKYDYGQHLITKLSGGNPSTTIKRAIYKDIMWVSVPLARFGTNFNEGIPDSEVKVRLRVAKSFRSYLASGATAVNGSNPSYEFNIPASAEISTNQEEVASEALDMIRVVPNPYYAYSSYEKTREDQLDNRVRIVNLPSRCTISIYTLNGTLVRQIKRDVAADVSLGQAVNEGKDDNLASSIDWDLKNTSGITVSSGVYYIHIDAGSLGEKVVKWLGVIRPIDLNSF